MSVPSSDALGQGDYGDIANAYWWMTHSEDPRFNVYKRKAAEYTKWEEREIKKGLPVWREEGLNKLYAHANELRPRATREKDALHESSTALAHQAATTDDALRPRLVDASRRIADGSMSCAASKPFARARAQLFAQ